MLSISLNAVGINEKKIKVLKQLGPNKRCRPTSDYSKRRFSLIRVYTVCHSIYRISLNMVWLYCSYGEIGISGKKELL